MKSTDAVVFKGYSGNPGPGVPTAARNNNTDSDNEGESELSNLQHAYRILLRKKQTYEKETKELLRRQKLMIEDLEMEKTEISKMLKGHDNKHFAAEDLKTHDALKSLLKRRGELDACIDEEKFKLEKLENEIRNLKKKLDKNTRPAGCKEDPSKNVKKLTSQIAMANNKFSTLLVQNARLREEIETLRTERETFFQLCGRLEKELLEMRKGAGLLLDDATEAFQIREESQARILRLNEQQGRDIENHYTELREIQREKRHVKQLKEFLTEKTKEREPDKLYLNAQKKQEAAEQKRKAEQKITLNKYEEAIEKINKIVEKRTKKDIAKQPPGRMSARYGMEGIGDDDRKRFWELAGRRKSFAMSNYFKEAVPDIDSERKMRRSSDHRRRSAMLLTSPEEQERLRELLKKALAQETISETARSVEFDAELFYNVFMEREDRNFALFKYVTEQSNDIENLQDNIRQLKLNIEQFKHDDYTINEEHRNIRNELQTRQKEMEVSLRKLTAEITKSKNALSQLKTAITGLASKVGVDTDEVQQLMNWTDSTTGHHVLTYLGLIEQRANEMMNAHTFLKYQDAERHEERMQSIQQLLGISVPAEIIITDYDIQLPTAR
ncbi:outer dynein arm protein 1-like [Protopterus annectens]|uniref:outer dynein arm protein 1-like n=1 Tax=Protopterus annectens TaxID=7888 RepID=UPI001CFB0825|nr:outer dynein arm protein 1-like [Protopterus annectens]